MKTLHFILFAILFFLGNQLFAQQQYVIDGKTYALNTESQGSISLLWNTIDDEYRFFLKKENDIIELKNSYNNGNYNEEYKAVLLQYTQKSADQVKLTLGSLRTFFDTYNASKDPNYVVSPGVKLTANLGVFGGLTNAVFSGNDTNAFQPKIGVDIELMDSKTLRRHAIVFRLSQTFANDEQKNSATQLSFNYRFKFVQTDKINVFVNTKVAAYSYIKNEFNVSATNTTPAHIEETSGGSFDAPIAFGLGAEYKVGSGYLFITYNDAVAINQDSNGEFPVDLSIGYKFSL